MSFFKEVADALGLEWTKISLGYQVINYNGEAVYVEGVKRIVSIMPDEIALDLGKAEIVLCGNSLNIFDVSGGSVMIKGNVREYRVKYEREEKDTEKASSADTKSPRKKSKREE